MNKFRKKRRVSKTMNQILGVFIKFIKDESGSSEHRTEEATEIIFQMILLAKKRGRPTSRDMEEENAA